MGERVLAPEAKGGEGECAGGLGGRRRWERRRARGAAGPRGASGGAAYDSSGCTQGWPTRSASRGCTSTAGLGAHGVRGGACSTARQRRGGGEHRGGRQEGPCGVTAPAACGRWERGGAAEQISRGSRGGERSRWRGEAVSVRGRRQGRGATGRMRHGSGDGA
nr:PE-PGRS family protein PE_PGRS16-like [Aegilops tauschii subsp. strangulata]